MHRWPVRTGGQCNDLGGKTAARPTQPVDFSERFVFLTRRQFEVAAALASCPDSASINRRALIRGVGILRERGGIRPAASRPCR